MGEQEKLDVNIMAVSVTESTIAIQTWRASLVTVLFTDICWIIWQAITMNTTASHWQMVNIRTIYCILLGVLLCHVLYTGIVAFTVEQRASGC